MGFAAIESLCKVDLEKDRTILDALKPDFRPVSNIVTFPMSGFTASFRFEFKASPTSGNQGGGCRIGLVQNVLYEKRAFKYSDGTHRTVPYDKNIIDCGDDDALPFYNRPNTVSRGGKPEQMVPYRHVSYNERGFGELLDPWANTPDKLAAIPYADVTLIDQPFFKIKLRRNVNRALLTYSMQIIAFRIWLVVLHEDQKQPEVLAVSDPFSVMYKCELWEDKSRGDLLSTGTPNYRFEVGGTQGEQHSLSGFNTIKGVKVHAVGKGGPTPVLQIAGRDARDEAWTRIVQGL